MPQWAKDMMFEIKKGNIEVTKYRRRQRQIARCKEEIEKGRKETKAEMCLEEVTKAQFELLRGKVRLIGDKTSSLLIRWTTGKRRWMKR